jgi:hypothetical protein
MALGRKAEAAGLLERAQAEAARRGLRIVEFEIRLALAEAGRTPAASLAAEARQAGFLRVARRAAALG